MAQRKPTPAGKELQVQAAGRVELRGGEMAQGRLQGSETWRKSRREPTRRRGFQQGRGAGEHEHRRGARRGATAEWEAGARPGRLGCCAQECGWGPMHTDSAGESGVRDTRLGGV